MKGRKIVEIDRKQVLCGSLHMLYRFRKIREDADEGGWCIAHETDQSTWRCENPSCNFVNSTHFEFCGFCGADRGGDLPPEYGAIKGE